MITHSKEHKLPRINSEKQLDKQQQQEIATNPGARGKYDIEFNRCHTILMENLSTKRSETRKETKYDPHTGKQAAGRDRPQGGSDTGLTR